MNFGKGSKFSKQVGSNSGVMGNTLEIAIFSMWVFA